MRRFGKILIANRGEIALRILRTARALGYRTVAVYSTADAHAQHAAQADEAVPIGEAAPARSYLNVAAILAAARATGADAVHPGYGFLAENPGFARACRDAGLVFIGPSPEAMEALGDKAAAKRRLRAAGVPCIAGYEGADQSAARLEAEAERIGYPVMIKAAAGGGGRGMRLAETAARFAERLAAAQSEARHAFGDGAVILERAVPDPRHVEIQIFADAHGNAVHLGERDCSVQRRHQKLIEEAPSPAVSPDLRERMGAVAVNAVKAIGYEGAGTLEFLLDRQGRFAFMEMNARLQVEHPVTEAITGLDLVEWQLRVAAGEPLPLRQSEIRFHGHAIEVRLCAEDATRDFAPEAGRLALWRAPEGVRVETALGPGATIPPDYDSMIAKIIAHGATREEARRKLARALDDTAALGVATNQSFLARCLAHPAFAEGGATTGFVAAHGEALRARDPDGTARAAALFAALRLGGGREPLAAPFPVGFLFAHRGEPLAVRAAPAGRGLVEAAVGEQRFAIAIVETSGPRVRFLCDGVMESADVCIDGDRVWVQSRGEAFGFRDLTHAPAAKASAKAGEGGLRAAMSGRVVAVFAAPGERVTAGQPLVTLEAMKMEHVHLAPAAGRVKALHVTVGDQAEVGLMIAEIEREAP